MKLEFSNDALCDLERARDYIAHSLKNPIAAKALVAAVIADCQQLKDYPQSGRQLLDPEGLLPGYRLLIIRNQIVIYRVEDDIVLINRILDGRTDYMRILRKDLQ